MEKLNESLLEQFSMEELEQRLETDPLAAGQLLTLSVDSDVDMQAEGCCLIASNNGEVN